MVLRSAERLTGRVPHELSRFGRRRLLTDRNFWCGEGGILIVGAAPAHYLHAAAQYGCDFCAAPLLFPGSARLDGCQRLALHLTCTAFQTVKPLTVCIPLSLAASSRRRCTSDRNFCPCDFHHTLPSFARFMDPLSIAAGAIAITQAASMVALGIRTLRSLANGPTEFAELLEDLTSLEGVLELTRASIEALQTLGSQLPARSVAALQTLHRELRHCTDKIEQLAQRLLAGSKGVDKKGQPRVSRTRWLREKDTVADLRARVQRLHLGLSTCFAAVNTAQA